MPAPTTSRTTAVVVKLDASRRVSGISITSLPEELRTPAGLTAALRRAYLDAVGARLDERLGTGTRPRGEKPVARTDRTPAPARSDSFGHVPHQELVEFWERHVPDPSRPVGHEVGTSSNRCVQVRLHTTDHFGDIDLDPGWLRSARVSSVAAAVLEAFQDAYSQRNPR